MNSNIASLVKISQKESRLIIGLMSGTSLDGLDLALCQFSGSGTQTKVDLLHFHTIPYTETIKERIRSVQKLTVDHLQTLCIVNAWLGTLHGDMVLQSLKEWKMDPSQVDIVASHGQTIYHSPKSLHGIPDMPNSTLQIGDGDHIAVKTGIVTLSDFRQKHVANGLEGAPLAFFGDYLLFSKRGESRIMLNIGGIANFTFLPGDLDITKVFCTDTGPGNTLVDHCVRHLVNKNGSQTNFDFDKDGEIAKSGNVNELLLRELKNHKFFQNDDNMTKKKGKTTGQELFNHSYVLQAQERSNTRDIMVADLIATLTRFTAETIAESVLRCIQQYQDDGKILEEERIKIFTSGGGKHNSTLMSHLGQLLSSTKFQFQGMNSPDDDDGSLVASGSFADAKEAILFATLANETIAGDHAAFRGSVSMGKISFPK